MSRNLVSEVVALACRLNGRKRGFVIAAEALGVTERTVKSIAYAEPVRLDDIEARAAAAKSAVLRARLIAARREIAAIEEQLHDLVLEQGDARCVSAFGGVR